MKIIKRTYRELKMTPEEFGELMEKQKDENNDSLCGFCHDVELLFEHGLHVSDKALYYNNGYITTSSEKNGIVHWSEKAGGYVEHVLYKERYMGNLLKITIHEEDYLDIIEAIREKESSQNDR